MRKRQRQATRRSNKTQRWVITVTRYEWNLVRSLAKSRVVSMRKAARILLRSGYHAEALPPPVHEPVSASPTVSIPSGHEVPS